MEKADFLKLGAFCKKRLSLKAQKELLSLEEKGLLFTGTVLASLNDVEKGHEFEKSCGSKLDLADFMDILTLCDQPTIDRIITDEASKKAFLASKNIEGYFIRNNSAIYYTPDIEATMAWFEKVLGWAGIIDARDETGKGVYGLILPHENAALPNNNGPYMQMMKGELVKPVAAMMQVWGVDSLRQRAVDNGGTQVTPVNKTDWGARLFDMTTCDSTILRFYEPGGISV
jgi:predicted enzyme related to lactoylglutathione lyase